MATDDRYCILIFKQRRARMARLLRRWVAISAIGVPFLVLAFALENRVDAMYVVLCGLLGLVPIGAAIVALSYAIQKHYRCPRCNRVPMAGSFQFGPGGIGYSRSVMANPQCCPRCEAPFV